MYIERIEGQQSSIYTTELPEFVWERFKDVGTGTGLYWKRDSILLLKPWQPPVMILYNSSRYNPLVIQHFSITTSFTLTSTHTYLLYFMIINSSRNNSIKFLLQKRNKKKYVI